MEIIISKNKLVLSGVQTEGGWLNPLRLDILLNVYMYKKLS